MKCNLITTRLCALAAHYGMCALLWNNRIRLLRQVLFSTNVVFTCTRSVPHSITHFMLERERFDGKNNIPSFVHILISRYIHCFLCNKKPQLCAYTCILVLWVWSLVHLQTKSPNHVQKNPNFVLTCVHTLLFWMWTLHFIWKYNAPSKFLDLDKSNKCVHTLLYFLVFRVRSTHCFIFLYLGLCPA